VCVYAHRALRPYKIPRHIRLSAIQERILGAEIKTKGRKKDV
jgi:hypothetical protein